MNRKLAVGENSDDIHLDSYLRSHPSTTSEPQDREDPVPYSNSRYINFIDVFNLCSNRVNGINSGANFNKIRTIANEKTLTRNSNSKPDNSLISQSNQGIDINWFSQCILF